MKSTIATIEKSNKKITRRLILFGISLIIILYASYAYLPAILFNPNYNQKPPIPIKNAYLEKLQKINDRKIKENYLHLDPNKQSPQESYAIIKKEKKILSKKLIDELTKLNGSSLTKEEQKLLNKYHIKFGSMPLKPNQILSTNTVDTDFKKSLLLDIMKPALMKKLKDNRAKDKKYQEFRKKLLTYRSTYNIYLKYQKKNNLKIEYTKKQYDKKTKKEFDKAVIQNKEFDKKDTEFNFLTDKKRFTTLKISELNKKLITKKYLYFFSQYDLEIKGLKPFGLDLFKVIILSEKNGYKGLPKYVFVMYVIKKSKVINYLKQVNKLFLKNGK